MIKKVDINKIVYSISIEDIQTVAQQEFGRTLTQPEIEIISEKLGNNLSWYDAIQNTINQHLKIE